MFKLVDNPEGMIISPIHLMKFGGTVELKRLGAIEVPQKVLHAIAWYGTKTTPVVRKEPGVAQKTV